MATHFSVQLNHEDEFKALCAQQSLKAITKAIENNEIPTRLELCAILGKEAASAPIYIIRKTSKIILHTWNFFNLKTYNKELNAHVYIMHLYKPYVYQCCVPFVCTAIRISVAVIGLFFPSVPLYGWQLAERIELETFTLWSNSLQKITPSTEYVYADIFPSNAIYYFGLTKTKRLLEIGVHTDQESVEKIRNAMSKFLEKIATDEPHYFRQQLYYDLVMTQSNNNCKIGRGRIISHDVKEILFELKQFVAFKQALSFEESDNFLKRTISFDLTIEKTYRLYSYLFLNIQSLLIEEPEGKFHNLKDQMSLINDQWSKIFGFGRARFPKPIHGFVAYSKT